MDQVQSESGQASQPIAEVAASQPGAPTREERLAARYPTDPPRDAPESKAAPAKERQQEPGEPDQSEAPEYALKAPEGFQIDNGLMEVATPTFRELGLSNDQAQQLVPLAVKFQERIFEQQNDQFRIVKSDWAKQAQADPEIGGRNWKSTVRLAGVALKAAGIGDKHPFRDLLNDSGIGNHPEMLKVFARLGRKLAGSTAPPSSAATRLQQRYPTDIPRG